MSQTYFEYLVQRRGIFTRDNYFAAEAFEILGKWLFGDDWTGFETQERPLPSPSQAAAERARLEDTRLQAQAEIVRIRDEIRREVNAKRIAELEYALKLAFSTRNNVASRSLELDVGDDPPPDKVKTAAQRRQFVEKRLYRALQAGEIRALLRGFTYLDPAIWQGDGYPHFRFDFVLSEAVVPYSYSSRRRHSMLFPVAEFREWLQKQEPLRPAPRIGARSAEEDACRLYLDSQIQVGTKRRSKGAHLAAAREAIPGLSVRAFNRIWDERVPAEWKKRGRPPKRQGCNTVSTGFPKKTRPHKSTHGPRAEPAKPEKNVTAFSPRFVEDRSTTIEHQRR